MYIQGSFSLPPSLPEPEVGRVPGAPGLGTPPACQADSEAAEEVQCTSGIQFRFAKIMSLASPATSEHADDGSQLAGFGRFKYYYRVNSNVGPTGTHIARARACAGGIPPKKEHERGPFGFSGNTIKLQSRSLQPFSQRLRDISSVPEMRYTLAVVLSAYACLAEGPYSEASKETGIFGGRKQMGSVGFLSSCGWRTCNLAATSMRPSIR